MFWGLVLEPSKSYGQVVETPFHVSMAALDLKNSDNQEEASTLILRQDDTEYVLANLSKKHKIFNIPLGLDFDVGEEIEFSVQGQSQIHLTGFLAGDDGDDLDEQEEEDETELEQKIEAIRQAEAAKRKLKENSSAPVKRQRILDESFNDDSDEDDSDIDEDDLDDDDDSDLSVEEFDSEELDGDEDIIPAKVKGSPSKGQKQVPKNQAQSPESKKQKKKQKQLDKQQQGNKQVNQQQQRNQGNQNNKTPQKNQQPKTPQKNQQAKTPQGKTPQGKNPQGKTPQPNNKQQNAKSPQGLVSHKKKKFKAENGHA